MRALKMTFAGKEGTCVNWDAEVSDFDGLAQKAVNHVMTQSGSDDLVVGRGTDALRELVSHGAFDLMAIQHTLNFAAQKAADDISQFDNAYADTAQIRSLRMRLSGIERNVAQAVIIVKNRAGEINNDNIILV